MVTVVITVTAVAAVALSKHTSTKRKRYHTTHALYSTHSTQPRVHPEVLHMMQTDKLSSGSGTHVLLVVVF